MHVAMTRAEERLILSGAARLGDNWPAGAPAAAPISWIGPALVPDVAALRSPSDAVPRPTARRVRARAQRARPRDVLRLPRRPRPVAPGEQLALAPAGGAPAGARAGAGAARAGRAVRARAAAPPAAAAATRSLVALRRSAPTASTSSAASACPSRSRRRDLRDADGRRPRPGRAALRGTLVHALLEHLDLRRAPRAGAEAVRAVAARARGRAQRRRRGRPAGAGRRLRRQRAARPARARRAPCTASTASRSRWRAAPLLNGFVDVLAEEADGARAGRRLQVRPRRRRRPRGARRGLLRRPAAHLRAGRAARRARPPSRSPTLFLERPAEPAVARYDAADATRSRPSCARARRRCWPARSRSPRVPHRGLCATCPGRGGPVLLPGRADRPRARRPRSGRPMPVGAGPAAPALGAPARR